ncbi:MAG: hypothetical protein PHI28_19520, partial [Mangrovibacterium sp.]|nr:hypothetical protein [Mangrovibacterium sp.]
MKKIVHLFFVLAIGSALQAQNTRRLDDLAFACVKAAESPGQSLRQGAKAIFFSGKPAEDQLKSIAAFFEHQDQSLILVFDKAFGADSIQPILQRQFGKDLVLKKTDQWPPENFLQKKKIIALFRDDITFTSSTRVISSGTYAARFSSDPLNKMVVFTPDSGDSLKAQCLQCWRLTGKVPNFVLLDPD